MINSLRTEIQIVNNNTGKSVDAVTNRIINIARDECIINFKRSIDDIKKNFNIQLNVNKTKTDIIAKLSKEIDNLRQLGITQIQDYVTKNRETFITLLRTPKRTNTQTLTATPLPPQEEPLPPKKPPRHIPHAPTKEQETLKLSELIASANVDSSQNNSTITTTVAPITLEPIPSPALNTIKDELTNATTYIQQSINTNIQKSIETINSQINSIVNEERYSAIHAQNIAINTADTFILNEIQKFTIKNKNDIAANRDLFISNIPKNTDIQYKTEYNSAITQIYDIYKNAVLRVTLELNNKRAQFVDAIVIKLTSVPINVLKKVSENKPGFFSNLFSRKKVNSSGDNVTTLQSGIYPDYKKLNFAPQPQSTSQMQKPHPNPNPVYSTTLIKPYVFPGVKFKPETNVGGSRRKKHLSLIRTNTNKHNKHNRQKCNSRKTNISRKYKIRHSRIAK